MNEELLEQIKEAQQQGWHLCVGCAGCTEDVPTCTIETRKFMGLSPEQLQEE